MFCLDFVQYYILRTYLHTKYHIIYLIFNFKFVSSNKFGSKNRPIYDLLFTTWLALYFHYFLAFLYKYSSSNNNYINKTVDR